LPACDSTSALRGSLTPLYYTGWCVVDLVLTVLLVSLCYFVYLGDDVIKSFMVWANETCLSPPLLLQCCTKPGKLAVMYMCARGIDLVSFYYRVIG
jgi:hypothetical protein